MKDTSSKIIEMRKNGFSYNEISKELNCSKSLISYHCKINVLTDIGLRRKNLNEDEIEKIKEYYKDHTLKETSEKFGISISTVKRYKNNKRELLTETEKKKRNYERVKTRRQKNKEKAVEYKGGECVKCGYKKCIWALDFHHKDPKEKDFNFAKYSTLSWERIKKEIDKCDLICSNCHREIHYQEYLESCNSGVRVLH